MMKIEQNDHNITVNTCPLSKTRAIIFGLGIRKDLKPLLSYRPTLLLNIADKPIIIHILEYLAQKGIDTFDLVLHHFPEQVEEKLESGLRWGININYHLAKDSKTPFTVIIPTIRDWEASNILIGTGDTLPQLSHYGPVENSSSIFYNYSPKNWSGWALLNIEDLKKIPGNTPYESIPSQFKTFATEEVKPFFSARNSYELKESNKKFINQEQNSFFFPTTTKKVEPGVWISRAVTIEPGVKVIPPILIGENTHIKSGARIGPNAIIENHCIIDNNSAIENSLICQNSYVGEILEINNCIVDRNSLINLSLGTRLHIQEEFLISESTPPAIHHFARKIVERTLGALLLAALSPIYLLMRTLFSIEKKQKLILPSHDDPGQWNSFDLYFFNNFTLKQKGLLLTYFSWLPTLINIMKGELSFIGTPSRSIEETNQLPSEWRKLYLKTKPGIITLCDIYHGKNATEDEQYASEAYYATQMNALFDIKLFFYWLLKKIRGKTNAS